MTDLTFEQLCELFAYTPKRRPLDTKEVAEFFGIDENTPEQWRFRGEGPRYFSLEAVISRRARGDCAPRSRTEQNKSW